MDILLPLIVIFFAGFMQSVAGFGFALLAMPLLHTVGIPLSVTAPLVALLGLTNRPLLILHYRSALNFQEIWRLSLSAMLAIPLGIWIQGRVNELMVTGILGCIIIAYAIFSLLKLNVPPMKHHLWEWGLGFLSGLLGGAYNVAGPPAVIYATGRCWLPHKFKANLQTFALISSIFITLSYLIVGSYTLNILNYYVVMMPTMLLGIFVGFRLDELIQPELFRFGVLLLLVFVGIHLLI